MYPVSITEVIESLIRAFYLHLASNCVKSGKACIFLALLNIIKNNNR